MYDQVTWPKNSFSPNTPERQSYLSHSFSSHSLVVEYSPWRGHGFSDWLQPWILWSRWANLGSVETGCSIFVVIVVRVPHNSFSFDGDTQSERKREGDLNSGHNQWISARQQLNTHSHPLRPAHDPLFVAPGPPQGLMVYAQCLLTLKQEFWWREATKMVRMTTGIQAKSTVVGCLTTRTEHRFELEWVTGRTCVPSVHHNSKNVGQIVPRPNRDRRQREKVITTRAPL